MRLREPNYNADIIFVQKIVNNVNCVASHSSIKKEVRTCSTSENTHLGFKHLISIAQCGDNTRIKDLKTAQHDAVQDKKFLCLKVFYFPLHWRGDKDLKDLSRWIVAENHFVWWISTHQWKEPAPFVGVSNNGVLGRTKNVRSCALCSEGDTPVRQ